MENRERVTDAIERGGDDRPGDAAETEAVNDPAAQFAALAAERDQLAAEKAELSDRLLRRQADFENLRRRSEREKAEIREFAAMDSLSALLPIVDDLERAITAECSDAEYAKGMLLIYQRLMAALEKLGLAAISSEGEKFDPHLHHAVESTETGEIEDHTILAELQKGYTFRGRLLRPAMVRVAVAPSSESQ